MAGKLRVVTGPVVVLPDATTGKTAYYYQGSVLPNGLNEDRVQMVIADGLVREDVDPKELTAEDLSAASAGDRLRAAGQAGAASEVEPEDEATKAPPKTANKDAWIAFRVAESDGLLTAEQLGADNGPTKPELQDDAFVAKLRQQASESSSS